MKTSSQYGIAALTALAVTFSASTQAGKVLTPTINGQEFPIDCEQDIQNGRPSYELTQRLEVLLGHGTHQAGEKAFLPEYAKKQAVENFVKNHKEVINKLIVPAAQHCRLD